MDPLTIGIAVGTALVTQVTKKLMEKAADPENVAKGVNWVFSAADHFLKVRKKEKSKDTPISSPPTPAPPTEPPAQVDDEDVQSKTEAVQEIAKSLEQETQAPVDGGIRLVEMDDFVIEQLASEVKSLMNQLETYLRTLRFEEEKAAQYGGLRFAPPIVMHMIRTQRLEIAERVRRLNKAMLQAYGVAASNLDMDVLVTVTED